MFLLQAIGISLSGVMAPGPVTAATLAAGMRTRHAGAIIALGHGIVEFPLMILIMLGMNRLFEISGVKIGIGLIGGAFLLLMGGQMLLEAHRRDQNAPDKYARQHPLWIGIILTIGNPYFLLWWATVGMALAARAWSFGVFAFALFAVVHWLCDLFWLEFLSFSSHKGASLFGPRTRTTILLVCGTALLVFGGMFVYDAGKQLV